MLSGSGTSLALLFAFCNGTSGWSSACAASPAHAGIPACAGSPAHEDGGECAGSSASMGSSTEEISSSDVPCPPGLPGDSLISAAVGEAAQHVQPVEPLSPTSPACPPEVDSSDSV